MPRSRSQFPNPFFQLPNHGFRPHVFQFPNPHFPVPESALLFPNPHSYNFRICASGFRIPVSQSARPVSESCFFGFRLRVCSFRILVFRFPNPAFRIRALQFPNSRAQFPNQFSSFRIRARRVFAVGPCQNAASDLRRCLGFQQSCATTCPAPADAGSKRHRLLARHWCAQNHISQCNVQQPAGVGLCPRYAGRNELVVAGCLGPRRAGRS